MRDDLDMGSQDTVSLPELVPETDGATALAVGSVVGGRYELLRTLGEGAMGTVYLAKHTALDREVAVKLIKHDVRARSEYARRFEREAKATSSLDHPHVVRVLDFGDDPVLFLVMEYIAGRSLRDFIREATEPPPLELVTTLVDQILSGLVAAHEHGIIHRDLKPDNVLVTWEDEQPFVKVVDFGLAHVDESFERGPTLTEQGVVAGTPAYMSPEQCQSMAVTSASDLYSIGCILTELLQLTPPFTGDSAAVLMSQQMFAPPPPLDRPADAEQVPEWLENLRLELLSKHAHRRPDSARAVRDRLRPEAEEVSQRRSGRGSLGEGSGRFERFGSGERLLVRLSDQSPCIDAAVRAGLALHGIDVGAIKGPNIIVLDYSATPDALSQIADYVAQGLQVIACVARPNAALLSDLINVGVADVVAAPVDPVALTIAVRRLERRLGRTRRKS